jgi:DNA-binding GntR family transcriptional regulator
MFYTTDTLTFMTATGRRPEMARKQTKPALVTEGAKPKRANRVNFFDLAYERIEELLINCELKPGRQLTLQELQDATGLGRTPVHNAVSRLAADTLLIVLPRHGLRVAPIDLARERLLLQLRRDMERFVVRLAIERASLSHRNQMLHIERALRERRDEITLGEFNVLDRRIDQILLAAADEPPPHRFHSSHDHPWASRSVDDDRLPFVRAECGGEPASGYSSFCHRCPDRLCRFHVH